MKMNLQYFAEPSDTNEETTPIIPEEQTPAGADTPDSTPEVIEVKTIPYDRFKQVNDDLKTFKSTFESLGLEGLDGLKSLVGDYQARKEADEARQREELTEVERLQTDLESKEAAEKELLERIATMETKQQQDAIDDAFRKTAAAHGIEYVDDAILLADLSGVEIKDGAVSGVEAIVKELVESKPFLLKRVQMPIGEPSNSGKGSMDDMTAEQMLEEAAEKARTTGLPKDRAEFAKLKRQLRG